MDKKLVPLTNYLKEYGVQTAEALAGRFEVSTKTIRNYIKEWNDYFDGHGAQIQSKHGCGYFLEVTDGENFERRLKTLQSPQARDQIPSTSRERVEYLMNDLLSRREFVTIGALSDVLYISRKTISADLKEVEKLLEGYDLKLVKRPNYGIRIEGTEFNRRLCIANVIVGRENGLAVSGGDGYQDDMKRVAECVAEVIDTENFTVNAVAYQNLIVHICIAVQRIRENCYVPLDEARQDRIRRSKGYRIAQRITEKLNASFGIRFPEEEVAYIAIHLAGKQSLFLPEPELEEASAGQVISEEAWEVVAQMLDAVYEAFLFDFRSDLELRMNLAQHIIPLAVRLRYNLRLKNPLLKDIKARFSMAYAIALHSSSILTQHYGNELKDDEVGYLALAFALAIERQNMELPKKNILIVCASGKGSAQLLHYRYRQEFGPYVGRIETCDVSNVKKVDFKEIDYVFTTVPIREQLPVPVREVKYFLESADIQNMKKVLRSEDGEGVPLAAYFEEELFFSHLKFDNRYDASKFLCQQVMRVKGLTDQFWKLVVKREQAAQTAFGNMVAMLHPWKAVTEETFVCVGILDSPVKWGDQEVQVIFLVSISNRKNKNLQAFYRGMTRMLMDADSIRQLIRTQTYDKLMEL
ncbi:MAG: PRD domain-containing protein [Clostridium sp.]|nr:PRD domain-containing protein [Clostridium sp.]